MLACSSTGGGTVCTDLFAFLTVVPIDAGGAPVAGPFVVTDTVQRTGAVLTVAQQGYPVGSATIFSDSYRSAIREAGDSVRVTGVATGGSFHATFLIGTDGCHIRKLSGSDTVVVR
ncbi:MAG: hypothetical protein ABUL71_02490 [Gemmatimonadota bacterium]